MIDRSHAVSRPSPNAPNKTSNVSQVQAEAKQKALEKEKVHQDAVNSDTVAIDFAHPSASASAAVPGTAQTTAVLGEREELAPKATSETPVSASVQQPKAAGKNNPMAPYDFDSYQGQLYRVFEGTVLEGVVTNHIDGGLTGPILIMLTTDYYSHDHQQLLMPQGTRLIGTVQSVGNAQQRKMFVTFHRAICPDGFSLELDKYVAQVDFKSKAKVFCRTYSFLSSVIPYSNAEWEKASIFLNFLTPKLPTPKEEDLAKGILDAIDMDSYRVEKKAVMEIALADSDAEIEPVPTEAGGRKSEHELDHLSNILKTFNDQFGTLFTDTDRVAKRIREDIAPKVAADMAYQNARENTPHTARMAHDQALGKVMQHLLKDDTQVYKQYVENESFRRFIGDMVYQLTNDPSQPAL